MIKFLPIFIFMFISCNRNVTPECSDEEVVDFVTLEIKKILKKDYLESLYNDSINHYDLRLYAIDRGLDFESVLEEEKKKIEENNLTMLNNAFDESKLKNIRSTKIDDELKSCSCISELDNKQLLKPISVSYQAQLTRDEEGNINDIPYITLTYKIEENHE